MGCSPWGRLGSDKTERLHFHFSLYALEKVYSSAFGWKVLKISVSSISSDVSFKTCISLLIFCFDDLSIGVSGVLKSHTFILLLSVCPFMSDSVCLMY